MNAVLKLSLLCTILCLEGSTAAGIECPAVDSLDHLVYFRHESDCSKFYECSNGAQVELSCPSGLEFNLKLNVCDYPEHVDSCRGSGGSDDGENGDDVKNDNDGNDGSDGNDGRDESDGTDGNGGKGSESGGSGVCPAVDSVDQSVYLPHKSDCTKFYKCSIGVPVELSCRSDLVFNPKLNFCDYPENVDSCPGSGGSDDGKNGGDDGKNDNDGNDGSGGNDGNDGRDESDGSDGDGGKGSGSGGSGVCSAVDTENQSVYLQHASDCSKFYKCSDGALVELSCRSGLLFNTNLNVCDYPENVDSCLGKNGKSNDV